MALVRCPTHKIPYNDENPRGCPACAREKDGASSTSAIQELARASQQSAKPPIAPAPAPKQPPARRSVRTSRQFVRRPTSPFVTTPPKAPVVEEGLLDKLRQLAEQRRLLAVGGASIAVLAIVFLLTSGPRFMEGQYPTVVDEAQVRPLPLQPNAPVTTMFSTLGTRLPKTNPSSPRLAQYSYGQDLKIDAVNSVIYSITLRIPNRSWRGLRAGMDQQTAEGSLALLGGPIEEGSSNPPSETVSGYVTYPSFDARPRRTLRAEVRPPNGCFDVLVDIQPRAIGILQDGENRYIVVAREGDAFVWVVTQIRAVSRRITGPYSAGPAC